MRNMAWRRRSWGDLVCALQPNGAPLVGLEPLLLVDADPRELLPPPR
jgi:hypothetical protein